MAALVVGSSPARAAERTFALENFRVTLEEVTDQVSVFYRSMRLNRAQGVWNVEVSIRNNGSSTLRGPLVLLLDGYSGTSGAVAPDGLDDSEPAKAFYDLSLNLPDGRLATGQSTADRTLVLGRASGAPALFTKVYAPSTVVAPLAVTRSLDGVGQPLPGVTLEIVGPSGAASQSTDSDSGVASLGQGAGGHSVQFRAEGYLPVWRTKTLADSGVTVIPNPRLTLREASDVTITPLGNITVSSADDAIRITFPPGSVAQSAEVTLTPVDGQNLPAFLPQGWSPLQAFWLEADQTIRGGLPAELIVWGKIAAPESAVLVRWNDGRLRWEVIETIPGNGTDRVIVSVPGAGAYALVVGDAGELAPPTAEPGQPLLGSAAPLPGADGLTARGSVTPPSSPASWVPELVTGTAEVVLQHAAAALPSGYLLRGEVTETYLMADGSLRLTPQYEHFIVGYQRPGDHDPRTLHARFPMRPVLLFGPDELEEATVRVDVLPEQPFSGQVLDQRGGRMDFEGIRIQADSGRLTAPSAMVLRRLDPTIFTNLMEDGHTVVAAFDLTVDASTLSQSLITQFEGVPPDGRFVLAEVVSETGLYGLQPIERLQSDGAGKISSLEPSEGERLPGLRGSGQFVLVEVSKPQGLISGVARNGAGEPTGGMPVRLTGLPWLAVSDGAGRYQLVGPQGDVEVTVVDPATGDTGLTQVTINDPAVASAADLDTTPAGPRVAAIIPADGATKVPRVTSVVIEFSESIDPASILSAVRLIDESDSLVEAALSLNLRGDVATLSPATELAAATTYRAVLEPTIADPTGLPLEGATEFSFTTVPLSVRDPAAQLIIYEPGATNVPPEILDEIPAYTPGADASAVVVHGTGGAADPEVAVILVNESTGQTATVLSKPDGSFSSVIAGAEDDFISATFVNLNGTRVYVPVSRQEFDNGFVGLYPQGGILEAQSDGGATRVLIEPNAIQERSKLRVHFLGLDQILQIAGGVEPQYGKLLGKGANIEQEGSQIQAPLGIEFDIAPSEIVLYEGMAGPEDGVFALCAVVEVNGQTAYQFLEGMKYEDGKLVPNSPPDIQVALDELAAAWTANAENMAIKSGAGFVVLATGQTLVEVAAHVPLPDFLPVQFAVAALQMQISRKVRVVGEVFACDVDSALPCDGEVLPGLPGATVVLRSAKQSLSGAQKGGLDLGAMFALTDANGKYSLMVDNPTLIDFLGTLQDDEGLLVATATHPRFYGQRPAEPVFTVANSPFAYADLAFLYSSQAGENTSPPFISVAHSPPRPAPGTQVTLSILATHGAQSPAIENPVIENVYSLAEGVEVTADDIVLSEAIETVPGPRSLQQTFHIDSERAARVILKIQASADNGQIRTIRYALDIGGPDTVVPDQIAQVDSNDKTPPRVIWSWPFEGARSFPVGEPIQLVFSEPVDKAIETDPAAIQISPPNAQLTGSLSADQQLLTIQPDRLLPGADYTLTVSAAVKDLAGNQLDQIPGSAATDSFQLNFTHAPMVTGPFPDLTSGGGAVTRGIYAYVLDRAVGSQNGIVIYDLSDPSAPALVNRIPFNGTPRDLQLVPRYSYVLRPGGAARTNDLLVVAGGEIAAITDENGNTSFQSQIIRVYELSNPVDPLRLVSRLVTAGSLAAVTQLEWEPPLISYLQSSAEVQSIGLINLQAFIIGDQLSQDELRELPPDPTDGVDLNGDGDYVDDGETPPLPGSRPFEFAGKVGSLTVEDSNQRILHYDLNTQVGHLSVTLAQGFEVNVNGAVTQNPIDPAYRILLDTGTFLPREQRVPSSFHYPGARPKRVFNLFGVELVTETNSTMANLAFVSVHENAKSHLSVLDISNALDLNEITTVQIPPELGLVQSVSERQDGLLRVETTQHVLLLNPSRLLLPAEDPLRHPAIVGVIPGAGSGSFTSDFNLAGFNVVSLGSQARVVQVPPAMVIGSLPEHGSLLDPQTIPDQDAAIQEVMNEFATTSTVYPARYRAVGTSVVSTLDPAAASAHFYVLVFLPGSAGETIDLALESLNEQGYPLRNKGLGFPPVRAVSTAALDDLGQTPRLDCDAGIRVLPAYRLSDRKGSPFYNHYLSRPFALTYESIPKTELATLTSQPAREILWSGHFLRVSLDPSMDSRGVIEPFVSSVDTVEKVIRPGASLVVQSLPADYVLGPNPPHHRGFLELPGTFGAVTAHSAEFRTASTDLDLPGRRMPIVLTRHIGGQDLYDGPFGRGWDFEFNQRMVELKTGLFPPGANYPLVIRGGDGDEIAGARDILFYTGTGQMVLFEHSGTNAPPELADDPLLEELGWLSDGVGFYVPETEGVFDAVVRFASGELARLTPEGTQYWYDANGRLSRIYDRFEKNELRISRNARGDIVRIDDESVEVDRYLEFGYYRNDGDPMAADALDDEAPTPYVIGKICRVRDYSGREVTYTYDECGRLTTRKGPRITKNGPQGYLGDLVITYVYQSGAAANGIRGIVAGSQTGSALVMSQQDVSDPYSPEVTGGSGAAGDFSTSLAHDNTAKAIAEGGGTATVGLPGAASASVTVNEQGLAGSFTLNSGTQPLKETFEYYDNGLVKKVTYPEGNWVDLVYDVDNANLRARANLLKVVKNPGPRPGDKLEQVIPRDDLKYNLTSGSGTDFNGNTVTYALDDSGKEVGTVRYGSAGAYIYTYNEFGQLESLTDPNGFGTTYGYDSQRGFLTARNQGALDHTYGYEGIDGSRGFVTRLNPPSGSPEVATVLAYTERGRVVTATQGSLREEMSWDRNGNLVGYSRTLGDGNPLVETREYEQNGFLTRLVYTQIETDGASADLEYSYTPDALWRTTRIEHPDGSAQEFMDYNGYGQPGSMDFGAYQETYTYDANGNLKTLVAVGGGTTTFTYDGHDRLIRTETPTGERWDRTYYGSDALKTLKITDQHGDVNEDSSWTRDELDRVTQFSRAGSQATRSETWSYPSGMVVRSIAGGDSVTWTFNDAALLSSMKDSVRTVTYTYAGDLVSAVTSVEGMTFLSDLKPLNGLGYSEGLSDSLGLVASYQVRHDGRVIRSADALGRTTATPRSRFGERLGWNRPLGIDLAFQFDPNRQPSSVKDRANKGRTRSYNDHQDLKEITYRDGRTASITYEDGARARAVIPGGQVQYTPDLQGRPTGVTLNFEGNPRTEVYEYDAFDRVKSATFPAGSVSYTYDPLGPLAAVTWTLATESYPVSYQMRGDGYYTSIRYPSGVEIALNPDPAGRVQSVIPTIGEPVILTRTFAAAVLPSTQTLGNGLMERAYDYDARGRPLRIAYRRSGDGAVLAEVRYVYTAVNTVQARQWIHRAGRTDFLDADDADRLVTDHHGARPALGYLQADRTVPSLSSPVAGGFRPGLYRRDFQYDGAGLDYLNAVTTSNPDALPVPAVDETPQPPDSLTRDSRGNQKLAEAWLPESTAPAFGSVGTLDLRYDGRGNLVQVDRPDLTRIEYAYDDTGLLVQRVISGPSLPAPVTTHFLYDDDRLIEEYVDDGNTNQLRASYFYADNDIPVAADYRLSDGDLHRHYFLTDLVGSVMGLADANGSVIERYDYSTHGVPVIELRDTAPPRVMRILSGDGGSLLVEFSERVLPPLNYADGTDLLNGMQGLEQSLHIQYEENGQPKTDDGAKIYEENLAGMRFGAVIRFLPQFPMPGALSVKVNAGQLVDEWGNGNPDQSIDVNYSPTPGTVLYLDDNLPDTGPERVARSAVDSPFLFHGQYYDYDTGLYYFRARHYNPYAGLFLQRDPEAYVDGPNLHAAFGHNPASVRDPDGRVIRALIGAARGAAAAKFGRIARASRLGGLVQRLKGVATRIRGRLPGSRPVTKALGDGGPDAGVPVVPQTQIRGKMQPAGRNTPQSLSSSRLPDQPSGGGPRPGGRPIQEGSAGGPQKGGTPSKPNGRTPDDFADGAPGRPGSTARDTSDPNYRPFQSRFEVAGHRDRPPNAVEEPDVHPFFRGMKRADPEARSKAPTPEPDPWGNPGKQRMTEYTEENRFSEQFGARRPNQDEGRRLDEPNRRNRRN